MAIGKVRTGLYGVIAEFTSPAELTAAAEAARDAGYTEMDAFSPFPIHGLHEAVGMKSTGMSSMSAIGLIGGGIRGGARLLSLGGAHPPPHPPQKRRQPPTPQPPPEPHHPPGPTLPRPPPAPLPVWGASS